MKISLVSNTEWSARVHRASLINSLSRHGHKVNVFCFRKLGKTQLCSLKTNTFPAKVFRCTSLTHLFKSEVLLSFTTSGNLFSLALASVLRKKIIVTINGLYKSKNCLLDLLFLKILRILVGIAPTAVIFVQNKKDIDRLVEAGIPSILLRFCPGSGVISRSKRSLNIPLFERLAKNKLVVGYSARDKKISGFNAFFDFASQNKEKFDFIAGVKTDSKNIKYISKIAKELRIKLVINYEDPETFFSQIDALYFYSDYHEGMPFIILESLSFGIPVICENTSNFNDIIDESNGILLAKPQCDYETLGTLYELRHNGRVDVPEFYGINNVFSLYQNELEIIACQLNQN